MGVLMILVTIPIKAPPVINDLLLPSVSLHHPYSRFSHTLHLLHLTDFFVESTTIGNFLLLGTCLPFPPLIMST